MLEIFQNHKNQLLYTLITVAIIILVRYIIYKTVKRVGKLGEIDPNRTRLIYKYFNFFITAIGIFIISIYWGVNIDDLGWFISSAFAVIGVAFFAVWSILSNVTAGIILFFSFPFKIGDRIRIQDKDFPTEGFIEDIRAFHIHIRSDDGELLTYPNNLLLQKGVAQISKAKKEDDGKDSI
ncbi:mechanosensitive ion channel domain-containing protein [Galbibacter sp.]|jgi:small-conductance mechanosensitive channel|uniref:mechanosensitive ion channel domain-containing protein n=1 Tax=Galbibacter sp. TaxID=2918471 RepID=UPI003A927164